jgi:hypothetical protein
LRRVPGGLSCEKTILPSASRISTQDSRLKSSSMRWAVTTVSTGPGTAITVAGVGTCVGIWPAAGGGATDSRTAGAGTTSRVAADFGGATGRSSHSPITPATAITTNTDSTTYTIEPRRG